MVGVPQHIAEVDHLLPVDIRRIPLDVVRQPPRRLTDNFELALRRVLSAVNGARLLFATKLSISVIASKIFRKPVFDSWRHSEYLNYIVGDPFGNARFQWFPLRYLCRLPWRSR